MTLAQAIASADALCPNARSVNEKTGWVNEAESDFWVRVFLLDPALYVPYTASDAGRRLLLLPPFEKLYVEYLAAKIALAAGETGRTAVYEEMFEKDRRALCAWTARVLRPAEKPLYRWYYLGRPFRIANVVSTPADLPETGSPGLACAVGPPGEDDKDVYLWDDENAVWSRLGRFSETGREKSPGVIFQ